MSGHTRSTRARGSTQRFDEITRALGKPDPELLPALLEGLDEVDLLTRLRATGCSVTHLIEVASAIMLDSYTFWQNCSGEQRAKLRGLSAPLLSLTAEQLRRAQQMHLQYLRRITEQEIAQVKQAKLMAESRLVCSQAVQVFRKVTGDEPLLQKVSDTLEHSTSSAELAYRLKSLAELGTKLLAQAPAPVRARASLFGLGKPYFEVLNTKASELNDVENRVNERPSKAPDHMPFEQTQALLFWICGHISDVFAMAHAMDATIPVMRAFGEPAEVPAQTPRAAAVQMPRSPERIIHPLTLPRVARKPT